MSNQKTILVIGGTGAMGRAVVKGLLQDQNTDWQIAIFSRSPESKTAQKLVKNCRSREASLTSTPHVAHHLRLEQNITRNGT